MGIRQHRRRRPGRPPSEGITDAQRRTFDAIRDYVEQGHPPTLDELCLHLDLSRTAVHESIDQLVRKGFLRRRRYTRRGLEVLRGLPGRRPSGLVSLPLVGRVAAGIPTLADENIMGEALVPARFIDSDGCFALKVHGDSMTGAGLRDGDTVIVRSQPLAKHGEVIVALVEGEATIKRLVWDGQRVELCPENRRYKPVRITAETDFRIIGKVIAQSSQWN